MNIFRFFKEFFICLPKTLHAKFWIALVLLFIQSLFELLSLGSIIPVAAALADSDHFFTKGLGARVSSIIPGLSPMEWSLIALGGMLAMFLVKNIVSHWISRFQSRFVYAIFQSISSSLHQYFMNGTLTDLTSRPSADTARDIVGVPQRFATNVVLATLLLLTEMMAIVFISLGIILYEPLAFVCAVAVFLPPFTLFYFWVRKKIQTIDSGINELEARLSSSVYESIDGYLDILATESKSFFLTRYQPLAERFSYLLSERTILGTIPARLAEASMILGFISLFLYSKFRVQDLSSTAAIFGIYLLGAYRLLPSANRITLCLVSIRGNLFSMDTVKLASTPQAQIMLSEPSVPIRLSKEVRLEHVSFEYPNSKVPILSDLSITVQKGECLGIVGPSGAGKSTLLYILIGALSPTRGNIYIDTDELTADKLPSWRHCVGYVPQSVFLMSGTLAENIMFQFKPDPDTSEHLERCIRMASLQSTIDTLPRGLSTMIGNGGQPLSVGQRQRVGIARALFHGAQVIIFDEPTSALDPETEKDIVRSISELRHQGFTIIIVSHKHTSLDVCDRIVKLDRGQLSNVLMSSDEKEPDIKTHRQP